MPTVRIGDIHIHYDTRGVGEPLLLIMGYRGSGFMWGEEFITHLSRSFRVIYFDNRGTGLSDKPDTLYTIPIMADDAAGLLRYLGIRQAYVFGVSMGGMIAQELVLRHPQMVRRLVLGCTSCGGPQASLASLEVLAKLIHPSDMSLEEAVRRQWRVMFSPKFLETQQDFLEMLTQRALLYPAPPHTSLRHFMALQRFNTYGRLGMITVPTLVITGADDIIVPPANSLLLATRIHGAGLEILPNIGHGFFWEVPWDVAALLHRFCHAL
jgi:pimeloyl-ACP methyl ester carboxylesterase